MAVVSRILFLHSGCPDADNDHSSLDDGCPSSPATYPEAWTGRPKTLPYLVLHRVGFTEHPRSPGDLVRSYRTVAPLPRTHPIINLVNHKGEMEAVLFLWH